MKHLIVALAVALTALPATAHDLGFAGLLSKGNREKLEPLTLASGQPVAEAPYTLKSGTYYKINIVSDGTAELALAGSEFFRAVWINEIVINKIEIRPMGGIHSIEFDDEGTAEISFIAIKPGSYELAIPGSDGDTQKAIFNIQ